MAAATAIELSDGMTATSDAKADERALVIAAQRGSSDAFASLVRLHQRRAYAVCRAIVLTHEDEPTLEPMTARAARLTFVYAALLAIGIAAA